MSLVFTLATRNLFHDRLRFVATVVGIVFSMLLVLVQTGVFLGFSRMVTTMIDHADADLWIMPTRTRSFEDPSILDEYVRFRALAVRGVAEAAPIVVGFAQWTTPNVGKSPVVIVGSDMRSNGIRPWNMVAGSIEDLELPGAVAVDRSYLDELGISGLGARGEIMNQKVEVKALTRDIRSFTMTAYVFAPLERARVYAGLSSHEASYYLVRLAPGADLATVQERLRADLSDSKVLTPAEFRDSSRRFWLFGTGAGAALFAGALLGFIVGTVIVGQTLYSSTKDHLNEFATLRAIGSSGGYINKVIMYQALLSAVIGFGISAGLGFIIVDRTADSALPVVMTPVVTAALFTVAIVMCGLSAIAAIVKVLRIDPAMVFTR